MAMSYAARSPLEKAILGSRQQLHAARTRLTIKGKTSDRSNSNAISAQSSRRKIWPTCVSLHGRVGCEERRG